MYAKGLCATKVVKSACRVCTEVLCDTVIVDRSCAGRSHVNMVVAAFHLCPHRFPIVVPGVSESGHEPARNTERALRCIRTADYTESERNYKDLLCERTKSAIILSERPQLNTYDGSRGLHNP